MAIKAFAKTGGIILSQENDRCTLTSMMKFEKYFAQYEQFKKVKVLALNLLLCFCLIEKENFSCFCMLDTSDPLLHPEIGLPDSDPINKAKKTNKHYPLCFTTSCARAVTRVMPAESGD